jgi:Zn-dependent membrane protease YugP
MFYDSTYILIIPAIILSIYAQIKVSSAFKKYSKIQINSGLTGKEIAQKVLNTEGLSIQIERVAGKLSDHYDPRSKVLRLSEEVYSGRSVAAAGVAAHEAGHAIQDAKKYAPLVLRTVSYPVAGFASYGGPILFFIGIFFSLADLLWLGIILYGISTLFYIITLPVEFNASSRAKKILFENGFVNSEEKKGVDKVLNAAAMTYVAAALMAVLQLIRYISLANRRR